MKEPEMFDDLRPYCDLEISAAMHRIAGSEYFPMLSEFIFPGREVGEVRDLVRGCTTISEFQYRIMRIVHERIVERSISCFTYSGLDRLSPSEKYLFVSNHRDIMLDAMLMQYALYKGGHATSEISFGSNLMHPQVVVDIGKSNKMFTVLRGGNMHDFYNNSLRLSEYIRHTLTVKRESVWIAQRNGRTKDGCDNTEQGIIKMFYMSKPQDPAVSLAELNIVPVAISYQWESCDLLKTQELYRRRRDGRYEKRLGEDLNSILTGIMQFKGKVHITFCERITGDDLDAFAGLSHGKFNSAVASLMDSRIHAGYHLMSNNYIAHDMRSGSNCFAMHYTPSERACFEKHYREVMSLEEEDKDLLREIFLGIYANSVDRCIDIPQVPPLEGLQ
ncbi:MAG: acyltransferase [Dysgonamonadaceae bacterium]|jgi:1-acyl-sn-glycerol-3-phosphate acyltransferase|nr:acyltransferase [Dysgonamonadaceae bacterium]